MPWSVPPASAGLAGGPIAVTQASGRGPPGAPGTFGAGGGLGSEQATVGWPDTVAEAGGDDALGGSSPFRHRRLQDNGTAEPRGDGAPDLDSRFKEWTNSVDWWPLRVIPPFFIAMRLLAGSWLWFRITKRRPPFPTVVPESHQLGEGKDFKYDLFDFDCLGACQYVIHGCCCPGARLSDTYATAGVGSYWVLFFAWEFAFVIARVMQNIIFEVALPIMLESGRSVRWIRGISHLPFAVASLCMALLLVRKRQALRRRLGDPEPQAHWPCDLLWLFLCPCCVIMQEAKQIDEAQNLTLNMCLCLREGPPADGGATVGPPVAVVGAPTEETHSHDGSASTSSRHSQRPLRAI